MGAALRILEEQHFRGKGSCLDFEAACAGGREAIDITICSVVGGGEVDVSVGGVDIDAVGVGVETDGEGECLGGAVGVDDFPYIGLVPRSVVLDRVSVSFAVVDIQFLQRLAGEGDVECGGIDDCRAGADVAIVAYPADDNLVVVYLLHSGEVHADGDGVGVGKCCQVNYIEFVVVVAAFVAAGHEGLSLGDGDTLGVELAKGAGGLDGEAGGIDTHHTAWIVAGDVDFAAVGSHAAGFAVAHVDTLRGTRGGVENLEAVRLGDGDVDFGTIGNHVLCLVAEAAVVDSLEPLVVNGAGGGVESRHRGIVGAHVAFVEHQGKSLGAIVVSRGDFVFLASRKQKDGHAGEDDSVEMFHAILLMY